MSSTDPKDTQPLRNKPNRDHRLYLPAVWAAPGAGGGHPKLSGGETVDWKTGAAAPRAFNRPDSRYSQPESVLISSRTARAALEYATSVVLLGADGRYEVRSPSGNNYDVSSQLDNCDCPDFFRLRASGYHTAVCKHILIVQTALTDPALGGLLPYSCARVAEMFGASERTIQRLCHDGVIPAAKSHGVWVIGGFDANAFAFEYASKIWPYTGGPYMIPLMNQLVGSWNLNSDAADSTFYFTDWVNNNSVAFTGTYAHFVAASSQYLSIASQPIFETGPHDVMTIALSVASGNINCGIWSKWGATSTREWALVIESNVLKFYAYDAAGSSYHAVSGSKAVNDGLVHSVIAWYDMTNLNLQIDGDAPTSSGFTGLMQAQNNPMYLGRITNVSTQYMDGYIGNAHMWKRVLTSEERDFVLNVIPGQDYQGMRRWTGKQS